MKLRHLDVLRACLALMVLAGHARMLLWIPWQKWVQLPHGKAEALLAYAGSVFRYGHQAVVVFFALSGFFIHLRAATAMAQGKSQDFNAREYLLRRARRILPPYYAVLMFTLLVDLIGRHWWPTLYLAQTGDGLLDSNFRDAGYSAGSVVPALLAQPSLFLCFGGNAPLGSIGNEVLYYGLYPLFMALWLRSRWLAYAVGVGAGALCWFVPWAGWWNGAICSYPIWLSGAFVAELLSSRVLAASVSRWFLISATLALGSFVLGHVGFVEHRFPLQVTVFMLLGAATVVAVERFPLDLMATRFGRVLEWLGVRSYSIYIFHFPVLVLISAWCFQTYGERPAHGWLPLAGLVLSLGAGLLGFQWMERRFLPARQKI